MGCARLFNRNNITKLLYILCSVSFIMVSSMFCIRSNAKVFVIRSVTWAPRRKGNVRDGRQGYGNYYNLNLFVHRYLGSEAPLFVSKSWLQHAEGGLEPGTPGQSKGERHSISWNQVKNSSNQVYLVVAAVTAARTFTRSTPFSCCSTLTS